jgi:uncharacterized membrane protein YuzA (DUF378 family)
MKMLNGLDWFFLAILLIGGLNWGMLGVFNVNLVSAIFGDVSAMTTIVYVLVGLSALYTAYLLSTKTQ